MLRLLLLVLSVSVLSCQPTPPLAPPDVAVPAHSVHATTLTAGVALSQISSSPAFDAGSFFALSKDVYADPATTPAEREQILAAYARSVQQVGAALGALTAEPPIALFCKGDPCRAAFAGPSNRSRGIRPGEKVPWGTYTPGGRAAVLIVAVGPGMEAVLAHEMVHAEAGARTSPRVVPSWFDEGLATLVGEAPDCRRQLPRGIDDLRRLDDRVVLEKYTEVPGLLVPVYCQARAEVDAWLSRAGKPRLFALLDAVRSGRSFYDAYGPMLTQPAGPVSTIVMSPAASIGDPRRPFSLVTWIRPSAASCVLAHVSSHPTGAGWCTPFLGFYAGGHLVAQLLHGTVAYPSSYAVARSAAPLPIGKWTHVAMTWAPGAPNRLYVDGTLAAEAASPGFRAPPPRSWTYVAWGSNNAGGAACWQGVVAAVHSRDP